MASASSNHHQTQQQTQEQAQELTHRRRAAKPTWLMLRLLIAVLVGAVGVQLLSPTAASARTRDVVAQAPNGEQLASQLGCVGCHSTDGSERTGPTWQGVAGSERTLADGSTVTADDAYLKQSILEPDSQIVEGFPEGVMSATVPPGSVSEEQANALVAYINTLSGGGSGDEEGGQQPEASPSPDAAAVDTPAAATTPPGPAGIYYAGWGLLALGGLLALVTVVAYLRFLPRFRRNDR